MCFQIVGYQAPRRGPSPGRLRLSKEKARAGWGDKLRVKVNTAPKIMRFAIFGTCLLEDYSGLAIHTYSHGEEPRTHPTPGFFPHLS